MVFGLFGPRLESIKDYPEIRALDRHLKKRDFEEVLRFYKSQKSVHTRECFVHWLCKKKKRPSYFDDFIDAYPSEALPFLLRGNHGVNWAWEARGTDIAVKQFGVFRQRLEAAREDLTKAAQFDPSDPTPFGSLISCAMGLGAEMSVVDKYLKRARKLAKTAWRPHLSTLTYLCEKWCGSHNQMFSFARAVYKKTKPGDGLATLIPCAHIERYTYASHFTNNQLVIDNYWSKEEVRREIVEAYHHSLGSPQFKANTISGWHRNFFAYALVQVGAIDEARAEFDEIGRTIALTPWAFLGDPVFQYKKTQWQSFWARSS